MGGGSRSTKKNTRIFIESPYSHPQENDQRFTTLLPYILGLLDFLSYYKKI